MANNNSFVSPKGVAAYSWLNKPDTKFNPEGVYKTSLVVDTKTAEPFIDAIKNAYVAEFGPKRLAQAKLSYKTNEDGQISFSFKSKNQPKFFDSKGKVIAGESPKVGPGSIIKISGGFGPYNKGANHGVTLYLNAVQIIDLVEFSGGPRFEVEEGGYEFKDDVAPAVSNDEPSDF